MTSRRQFSQKTTQYLTLSAQVIFFLLLITTSPLSAEEITMSYDFSYPDIVSTNIGKAGAVRVTIDGTTLSGQPGAPLLPVAQARILLPPEGTVEDIKIITTDEVSLGKGYVLEPAGVPYKLSEPGSAKPPVADMDIYSSENAYPGKFHDQVTVQKFRGYNILILKLYPLQYIPQSGELIYHPSLNVEVEITEAGDLTTNLYRSKYSDEEEAALKVDNPNDIDRYSALPARADKSGDPFDLLIITTTDLADGFYPLKDYHDTTGIATQIVTTDVIGSTNPDDIRAYITDAYLNSGIEYVIIGADDDIIPAKDLYVRSWEGQEAEVEYAMPSDLYFGCLDGTWNYDGDSRWGEPTDGENGGEVDLFAEVYVGRFPVGTSDEVDTMVAKTLAYSDYSVFSYFLKRVQLVGENLGFGGVSEWGGNLMDELVGTVTSDGYTTVGFSTDDYAVDRLYDRDWDDPDVEDDENDWPKEQFIKKFNRGIHFVNHLGHGNVGYAMKLYNNDVDTLENEKFGFLYSQTCLAGHFDNPANASDCFAEFLTVKYMNGCFALVMNARYGWGSYNSTDGPSQRFHRRIVDAVYAQDIRNFSKANQHSREETVFQIDDACMRWCYYELNYFGDPTIEMKYHCNDIDQDGYPDEYCEYDPTSIDNCRLRYNPDQVDSDGDSYGDSCDVCPGYDDDIDSDGDSVADGCDECPGFDDYADGDHDGIPDSCDICPDYHNNQTPDSDGDGYPNGCDNCAYAYNPDQANADGDSNGDACDKCEGYDDDIDSDMDTTPDGCDLCPGYFDFLDLDGDGMPNDCEKCPGFDDFADYDGDSEPDSCDNCPVTFNPDQADSDGNGIGDACDNLCGDANNDGTRDVSDAMYIINFVFNSGQQPSPLRVGDGNCDGSVDVSDATYLISFIFSSGSSPCDPDDNGVPDC